MKRKLFILLNIIFCLNLLLSCKSDNKKNDINKKTKITKKSITQNTSDSVNNVTLIMYDTYDNILNEDCILNIKKGNLYIKYSNQNIKNLSRSAMSDSIKINKNDERIINHFYSAKICNLRKNYSDGVSDGVRVRRIYFLNHDKAIIKQVNIIGEPKNIDSLKTSCDFLFKKIIENSQK